MKKSLILIVFLMSCCVGGWAQTASRSSSSRLPAHYKTQQESDPEIIRLSREGDIKGLRQLFAQENSSGRFSYSQGFYYLVMKERDRHGNNALHVANSEKTFDFLLEMAYHAKDELLSQQNKAGETPWMSLISYDRAAIFIRHFPSSALRQELKNISKELESNGVNLMVAAIKRDALVKECSAGGQTMWQRADALWRMAPQGSVDKANMYFIRTMIGKAAPFLIR